MHPILVDAIKHVVGAYEADVPKAPLVCLESGVSGLGVWAWQRLG